MTVLRDFIKHPSSAGLVLMGAALLALAIANSPLAETYHHVLHLELGTMSVLHVINDGLMALFFLLVGLEIKRELTGGELATWPQRILPGAAALGGMIGPALIYLALNAGVDGQRAGWAIPSATDIAFALGVLSLLGPRVPVSLKVFLAALAIIDDLGAVLIIAIFYSGGFNILALVAAAAIMLALVALNRAGVTRLWIYLSLGVVLWVAILQSGLHATLAGVLLSLAIPLTGPPARLTARSPLLVLEHALSPFVNFLIVPLFGFANAGVSLAGFSLATLFAPVPLGVMAGLFLGKQIGVFSVVLAVIRLGWARRPNGATWLQLYGVALLCGIGFTMSIFIGLLAFPDAAALQDEVKLGVLLGSTLSACLGALMLVASFSMAKDRH